MARSVAVATLIAAAVAAGGCQKMINPCDAPNQNSEVIDAVAYWYLYPDLLPASADPHAYAGPAELLDALTATAQAQGKDRGWSYVSSASQVLQFFGSGQSVGFGIVTLVRGSQVFVGEAVRGSAAADAGFLRGDEILRIGATPATLVPVADLLTAGTFTDAFGPATPGLARTLEVKTSGGATVQRTMTKRIYSIDPVPSWKIVDRTPLPPVGYVQLRAFVDTAEVPLRTAFAAFRAAGVTEVLVDLRYNGGGSLAVAEILANLLADGHAGQVMYSEEYSAQRVSRNSSTSFTAQPEAVASTRIAFVTTADSASASELVPNALDPTVSVALVGDRTYGKPVGQLVFTDSTCDLALGLVAFRLVNSAGDADYFTGLPDAGFRGPLCAAADDLTQPQDSTAEASTAAALSWLDGGTCPPPPAAPLVRARAAPRPRQPTPAQVAVPGLF